MKLGRWGLYGLAGSQGGPRLPWHPHKAHIPLSHADSGKAKQAACDLQRTGGLLLTCLRLGEALIPPWDRMWPFRAGRLLNSFRQMEQVSLFLASNCSPNAPLVGPLLKGRATREEHTHLEGKHIYHKASHLQCTHFIYLIFHCPRP